MIKYRKLFESTIQNVNRIELRFFPAKPNTWRVQQQPVRM